MKSPLGLLALIVGLIIMASLAIFSHIFEPKEEPRDKTAPLIARQRPGAAGSKQHDIYLKGGPLQRGLPERTSSEEFIFEQTEKKVPGFTKNTFTVHAGKIVSITLQNESQVGHEHNWVLVKPGTQEKVQAEAVSAGPSWGWIPDSADVLAFVPLTRPGESITLQFRAPAHPGDYPFLCTFPGHGEAMKGTLHVVS